MLTHTLRVATTSGRLNLSATTVARPQAVKPAISVPSSLQTKCSVHRCWRGLYSAVISPDSGSSPSTRSDLKPLQATHARQRFSSVEAPPLACGIMWSIWHNCPLSHSEVRQYSHRLCARARTNWTRRLEILLVIISGRGEVGPVRQLIAALRQNSECLRPPQDGAVVRIQ